VRAVRVVTGEQRSRRVGVEDFRAEAVHSMVGG
jgi:hypothetical protein